MSLKKYFEITENIKALSGKTADDIGSQVESVAYHEQDILNEERFIPRVNFSDPANFARYGSAVEYYDQSIKRIYNEYPYDGSLREKLEWRNKSTYIDLHIFDNLYPRTNGYVILSADGWGTQTSTADGYGLSSDLEYIYVEGGPNPNPNGNSPKSTKFTGSNYYEPDKNRGSNLEFDLASQGASLEFWLNKSTFITGLTEKEVIFDLWNGELSSSATYLRFRLELTGAADGSDPFLLTVLSGTTGFSQQSIAASTFTTASVADGNWHHYAVSVKSASAGVTTRFYVDGNLNNESTLGTTGINNTDSSALRAYVGALITSPSGSSAAVGAGKLSGSIDELRYWKTQRSSKEIGRFWFTQVGGGVNTDPTPFTTTEESANVDLGVYFKFNEGITGRTSTDSTVLDYSGRFSNGAWTGYGANSRNTGSAIVLSNAAISEFRDPIIYSFHPDVVSLSADLETSGSAHDVNNNASIYNSIPSWITEEDVEGTSNVKYLTQIISSYFDTLHLQIESLNHLKDIQYPSGSDKPLPFAEKLLSSYGFVAPEIFLDADVLEKLADRSEDRVYEKSLHDVKNIIYQNIYNNLNYIYKSKGTEKAFRNLIRCFGIDDELVKFNIYANNVEYEMRNNRRSIIVGDKFANFNTAAGQSATVYNYTDASNANSVGFITSSSGLTDGYATTLEAEILFPKKLDETSIVYVDTNTISASLFGVHGTVGSGTDTTWASPDAVNFQVFAVRDELKSTNVKFVLTGTAGGYVPEISSSLYEEVYDNTRWNLAVRVKPEQFPLKGFVSGTNSNYVVELHGVQVEAGEVLHEFTVSGTIASPPAGFVTGSKRVFVGAHRTNFTGALLQTSDVKVNACRYWLDYIEDGALRGHLLDTENYGAAQPHLYAYPFDTTASYGEITKFDTLVFDWEFLTNTGSNASGQFIVDDISSGSAALTRFGDLGNILNKQYTARGDFFQASSTNAIDKDFVVSSKLNLPENIQAEDMVRVLSTEDQDVFTTETRPINYFFAFEKSMYQTISEEMVNYFATLKDLHNLIGDPVERWRPEYKQMKFMRQKFFEKVGNDELDFDKFYEFYKWFDSSLSLMLGQLVPASADFSDNVKTVIENHVLERPKYRNIFPFLERVGATDIEGTVIPPIPPSEETIPGGPEVPGGSNYGGDTNASSEIESGHYEAPPTDGSDTENRPWQKYRREKTGDREGIFEVVKSTYDRYTKSTAKLKTNYSFPYDGVTKNSNYDPNFVFQATQPYGPTITATNIPKNIMLSFDIDVEELLNTTDIRNPRGKTKLSYGINPSINKSGSEDLNYYGKSYGPFSLYSSSVTTGYNSEVVQNYKSGTMVTNLHHDLVFDTGIPAQGPFTEKFVGGRYYRHTELNDGNDTRETRAEGFRLALGLNPTSSNIPAGASGALGVVPPNYPFLDSPAGSAPLGWLPALPTAQRLRDETAKRPVNIKNILMTTASVGTRLSGTIVHSKIGNYQKNYQVVQTAGRTTNDLFFREQTFNFAPNPETLATRGRLPLTSSTQNVGGDLDYALPDRSGPNSNETVFVNLFSSPGSYEVLSRGYRDPAHEELSVYNASPYRNLGVITRGQQESASLDPVEANTIAVVDQINKNRGLNQRAALHAGPFGSDAAYGSVPELTYVTVPSWHKTNRNRRRRIELSGATYITASVYDNLFVQHAIPRSAQQYSWVTASLAEGQIIYGNDRPSCFSASVLSQLIVSGTSYDDLTFVGLTTRILDPVTASSHIQGLPLDVANYAQAYDNGDWTGGAPVFQPGTDYFNFLITTRNGPYGYPTWKQIRTGETKIARKLRETNKIGYAIPPKRLVNNNGAVIPKRPNSFVDFYEAPYSINSSPITFIFEDNTEESETKNNIEVSVPFRNQIDYFSHNELNNFYDLKSDVSNLQSYKTVLDFTISSSYSTAVTYTEALYPADINMFNNIVRRRTKFSITNIWDDNRRDRSLTYGGNANSQGITFFTSASTWPLDAHLNFALTTSVNVNDGAGELQNAYTRFANNTDRIRPGVTYADRVPAGSASLGGNQTFAGDALWEAGTQSGKKPYESYSTYSQHIARVGKDHSIVPEFRISELFETYSEEKGGDFLADVDNIFNLTGAHIYDSAQTDFFKTYTNSDFLKYFSVIDDDLNDQRSGDLKIQRDRISLRCNAMVKFLPYKGFYPAERILELGTLFSQSYGTVVLSKSGSAPSQASLKILLEPMMSPGILCNTIKSGIAVSYPILSNTSSNVDDIIANHAPPRNTSANTRLFEGVINYDRGITNSGNPSTQDGFLFQELPFETLYRPETYLGPTFLTGSGAIYDNAVSPVTIVDNGSTGPIAIKFVDGKRLYRHAIDNFLCATTEFFTNQPAAFLSSREDQFNEVVSGSTYEMELEIFRTQNALSGVIQVATASFSMYDRESAYGYPINDASGFATFDHVTPPYFSGSAKVTISYTATATGRPTLEDILSNASYTYSRDTAAGSTSPASSRMQIDASINFSDYFNTVPNGTATQSKTWLIQSKFETPVLNFAGITPTRTTSSAEIGAGLSSADQIKTGGMWHLYGNIPESSREGIFISLRDTRELSLADVCGFPTGKNERVGDVKESNILEEAVVAVPFKTVNNRRKFFGINKNNSEYNNIKKNLEKYVFPPKFDFATNNTVDPILMYAFEFSAKVTQQDIADMWQNLPPDINEKFEQKEVIIDDKQVLDLLVKNAEDIQWLVFKVKKRANKSFEKYRRSLVTEDTSAIEDDIGPYSYNWPYDYFSLVELVKIDETVQYASSDVLPDNTITPGIEDLE
jgi:hypothetical protein